MHTIEIKDESAAGKILNKILLEFESEYVSVKELIEARIKVEIDRYENGVAEYQQGLVSPSNLEQRLNQKKRPIIDLEKQVYSALDAFQKNGFFILVGNEQVEKLEQKVWVHESTEISFIKLTQIVGG